MIRKFLCFAILLWAISASAQATFSPGIRGGLNWSNVTQTEMDFKGGYYVSAFGNLKLTRFYSLQPEVGLSSQGAKGRIYLFEGYDSSGNVISEEVDNKLDLQYLSFGLINKFTFMDRFGITVGPVLDFKTSSNISLNTDLDVGFSLGMFFNLTKGLSLEARFKQGFLDIIDSNGYEAMGWGGFWFEDFNTNSVFQIGLSYQFDLKAHDAQ